MKKLLVFLLAFAMVASLIAALPFAASADEEETETAVWSGKANIQWYLDDPEADEFHLQTAEDLAGLSYLVNAYYDKDSLKTCYNGLWYDKTTGEVLGFEESGAEAKFRFDYSALGFYIPRPQQEGQAYGYTQTTGKYRPLYSNDVTIEEPIDNSAFVYGTQFYGKTIYLDADLVMNEGDASTWGDSAPANVWMPIAGGRNIDATFSAFNGAFMGNGHTISGLYFSETNNNIDKVGLFGHLARGATVLVQDLVLKNCYFEGYREIGGIVGRTDGPVTLFNCHVANVILKGTAEVASMVGPVHNGSITLSQCSALNITVEAQRAVGGLISNVDFKDMFVSNCIVTGLVRAYAVPNGETKTGGWDAGVLVGRMAEGRIFVNQAISVVELIQEGTEESAKSSSYSASAGVVYGAVAKKDNKGVYHPAPTVRVEGYYYVDKVQATGTVLEFDEATKVEQELDLTGPTAGRQIKGFDFDEIWGYGEIGEFPYLRNAGKSTDEGGTTPTEPEIDHSTTHEWFEDNRVPEKKATCVKDGVKEHYECSCGQYFDMNKNELTAQELIIPATGKHTYGELIPAKEATAEAEGMKAHYECSVCHKLFDESKNEASRADLTIPKLESKGGCFGVVAGVPFVAVVVFGAALLIRKKEEKNK